MARRAYKWEVAWRNTGGGKRPTDPAQQRHAEAAFANWETDCYSLKGWKAIAAFMLWDERNARRAYAEWPEFRQCIRNRGGRYAANPAMLMDLQGEFLNRRDGRAGRCEFAQTRPRRSTGKFKSLNSTHVE